MSKGYWIAAYHEIRDADALAAYAALAGPAIETGGGKFLARGMASEAFEAGLIDRTVIIEFPSVEAAGNCYRSDAYAAALAKLGDAVVRDMRIVEGVE